VGDEGFGQDCIGFYVSSVVLLQQIRCMNVIGWLPCVVTLRVFSPFDEILQGTTAPEVPVVPDGLHLILHFSFDKVWWQLGEVWPVLCHFMIG
jgi:hypothetical protein